MQFFELSTLILQITGIGEPLLCIDIIYILLGKFIIHTGNKKASSKLFCSHFVRITLS